MPDKPSGIHLFDRVARHHVVHRETAGAECFGGLDDVAVGRRQCLDQDLVLGLVADLTLIDRQFLGLDVQA